MEQLKLYLAKARDAFWQLVSKVESSVLFERLVNRYESLPTRQQKTIKASATLGITIVLAWFAISPFVSTRLKFSENRSFFSLISSMKLFNSKLESARKEYIIPVGWQNVAAGDLRQLEDSITVLMASLGIPEELYEVAPQGATIMVHAREATIKQLETFLFQLDGLYPRYAVIRNKTSLHPTNKELVQFELEIGPGSDRGASAGANLEANDEEFDNIENGDFQDFPPPAESVPSRPRAAPTTPPTGDDNDFPPPPTGGDSGGVPGFEPPSFSPLDGEEGGEYNPSNRGGGDFTPPMGDDFIPPPPPSPDDESFDVVPMPEDESAPMAPSFPTE